MVTKQCQLCGTVLVNVWCNTRYCDTCRKQKKRQAVDTYRTKHSDHFLAYQRKYQSQKRQEINGIKHCVICDAVLPAHASKYCKQCRVIQIRNCAKKSFRKTYNSEQKTIQAREYRLRRLDAKIETYRHTIPVLPKVDAKSVCKAMQCDPSVEFFETTILPKLQMVWDCKHPEIPFPDSEREHIIQQIRWVNKICHKKNFYPVAKTIILLALWAHFGRVETQEYLAKFMDSNAVTLRFWVSQLNAYFPIELRASYQGKRIGLKRNRNGIYTDIP